MHRYVFLVWNLIQCVALGNQSSQSRFYPQTAEVGSQPIVATSQFKPFNLSPQQPFITLDYGYEVAGYPFFEVSQVNGEVQIEVKYTEAFAGLNQPFSDGPFDFSVGVTNSYRVETFAINQTGSMTSFLAQGGQRWQTIKLLTSGNVSFSAVGLASTIQQVNLDSLPSQFNSSNALYNSVWKLGARAATAACFDAGVYKAIWEISSENGAKVRGMRAPLSTVSASFENYTLTFQTKIERGGSGWTMAYPLPGVASGLQLNLVGNYPNSTTYVNTNRTLLPPNSVVMAHGFGIVNQTSLPSYYLGAFPVSFEVQENVWHNVSVVLGLDNYVTVFVNGARIFNVTLNDYYIPPATIPGSPSYFTAGAFGFGGWQDQIAYIKNVVAYAINGTEIYNNPMTDASIVLPDYGAQANLNPSCVDGAKRDRLLWTGDFFHTARIIGASTMRNDYVTGTLQSFIDWQLPTGQFALAPVLSLPSSAKYAYASVLGPSGPFYLLSDYHVLVILSFVNYMEYSNDVAFAAKTWPGWKLAVTWLTSQYNSTTGLFDLTRGLAAFLGPTGGSAVNGAIVQALKGLATIATAINDTTSATQWTTVATNTTTAINNLLWNETLGVYINGPLDTGNFSVAGVAFCITSGAAAAAATSQNTSRATRSIAVINNNLKLSPGYKDSTTVTTGTLDTLGLIPISPNTNGFLLTALLQSNATTEAKYLLDNLWSAMVTNTTTTTGASWEYVNTENQPGLQLFTSLSHPWGGAPTYAMTEYIAGIRPVSLGYGTWIVEPAFRGFDVTEVSARVVTPFGGGEVIQVEWELVGSGGNDSGNGTKLNLNVSSPVGTKGTVRLKGVYLGIGREDVSVDVQGGGSRSFSFDV